MKALISGITGQDGRLLTSKLLALGCEIVGLTRSECSSVSPAFPPSVRLIQVTNLDYHTWFEILKAESPSHIYHLAADSRVGYSFTRISDCIRQDHLSTLYLLESIKDSFKHIRVFLALSTEIYGDTDINIATEDSPLSPLSPYALSKSYILQIAEFYRSTFSLWISCAILSNHESPYRQDSFVTMKIVKYAYRISKGYETSINLGNLSVIRDWGWADEYVDSFISLLAYREPITLIIATGVSISLADFASEVFSCFNLQLSDHLVLSDQLKRPSDPSVFRCNPHKAYSVLGWKASISGLEVAQNLVSSSIPNFLSNG